MKRIRRIHTLLAACILALCLTMTAGWLPASAAAAESSGISSTGAADAGQDPAAPVEGTDSADNISTADSGSQNDVTWQADEEDEADPDDEDDWLDEQNSVSDRTESVPGTDSAGSADSMDNSGSEEAMQPETAGAAADEIPENVEIKLSVKVAKTAKKYSESVMAGDKIRLSVIKGSSAVKLSKCKFSSSKKSVASVSSKGVIKARKKGTAVITVKYKSRKAKVTVKVKKAAGSSADSSSGDSSGTGEETEIPSGSVKIMKGAPGKRTIKAYLQNALVPCGRTLYIYGGGWGNYGTKIGYQSSWKKHFNAHAGSGYKSSKYKFKRSKGLDCSGFAGWTLYNTLYSKSGKHSGYACSSTVVAKKYASKGWATLAKNSSDKTFKPGDVVSKGGHVWISMGQCSDGSVVIIHSTPESGAQISGTKGKAAELAKYYMKKYFPKWPYTAKHMGDSYWKYKSRARWKVKGSGHILSDPDGIQKMSAEQVLQLLLGK